MRQRAAIGGLLLLAPMGGRRPCAANAGQNFQVLFDRESSVTPSEAGGSAGMTAIVAGYLVQSS